MTMRALEQGGCGVYRYAGGFTIGGLFEGTICPVLVPEGYRKRVESAVSRRRRLGPFHYDFVTGNSNKDVHSKAQYRCCNDRQN